MMGIVLDNAETTPGFPPFKAIIKRVIPTPIHIIPLDIAIDVCLRFLILDHSSVLGNKIKLNNIPIAAIRTRR